jgi:hypothetical protein
VHKLVTLICREEAEGVYLQDHDAQAAQVQTQVASVFLVGAHQQRVEAVVLSAYTQDKFG